MRFVRNTLTVIRRGLARVHLTAPWATVIAALIAVVASLTTFYITQRNEAAQLRSRLRAEQEQGALAREATLLRLAEDFAANSANVQFAYHWVHGRLNDISDCPGQLRELTDPQAEAVTSLKDPALRRDTLSVYRRVVQFSEALRANECEYQDTHAPALAASLSSIATRLDAYVSRLHETESTHGT